MLKLGTPACPSNVAAEIPKVLGGIADDRLFSVNSVEAAMGGEKCADACGKLPSVFETLADYPK